MYLKPYRFRTNVYNAENIVSDSLFKNHKLLCMKCYPLSAVPSSFNFIRRFHVLKRNKSIIRSKANELICHEQKLDFIDISKQNIHSALLSSERKTYFPRSTFSTKVVRLRNKRITDIENKSKDFVNFERLSRAEVEPKNIKGKKPWKLRLLLISTALCGGVIAYSFGENIDQEQVKMNTKIIKMQTELREMKKGILVLNDKLEYLKRDTLKKQNGNSELNNIERVNKITEKINKNDDYSGKKKEADNTLDNVKFELQKCVSSQNMSSSLGKFVEILPNLQFAMKENTQRNDHIEKNKTVLPDVFEQPKATTEKPSSQRQNFNDEIKEESKVIIDNKDLININKTQDFTEVTKYKSFDEFEDLDDYANYIINNVRPGQKVRCWRQFVFGVQQGDRGVVSEVKGQVLTVHWQSGECRDIRCYWVELE